ncbi:hypothetical protein E2C01_092129 [Portunus trituberculatus]|uniref:Uncharacterized protein n=1 Tax=Portunus trituberculatus TaxID=210409 RepID=A0A5B7JJB5_PORTR|nr:hypothetical protein [Portunus trituberculatus]
MKVNIRPDNRHAATIASEPSLECVMDVETESLQQAESRAGRWSTMYYSCTVMTKYCGDSGI